MSLSGLILAYASFELDINAGYTIKDLQNRMDYWKRKFNVEHDDSHNFHKLTFRENMEIGVDIKLNLWFDNPIRWLIMTSSFVAILALSIHRYYYVQWYNNHFSLLLKAEIERSNRLTCNSSCYSSSVLN